MREVWNETLSWRHGRYHQKAFANFFAQRARYPRHTSRTGRQAGEDTRSAFRRRDGRLSLAKQDGPLALV